MPNLKDLPNMQESMDNDIFKTLEQGSGFKIDEKMPTIIKVVGVGGGGNNAINHMYAQNINGVSFVVINTDRQALQNSPVPNRLLIGPNTTFGLGAGNDPEKAKAAAEESADDISSLFDDETKMVFITAGMGGGTGTGAAPVVARIARDKGILTIGIVTIPFLFEGTKKILKALSGADEMQNYVDALLIINNERLTEIYPDLDFVNAFGKADDTLSIAARSISELITAEGKINLDFNDVNTTLRDGGVAIISSGYGEGEHRVTKAIEDALESPLLRNRDVYGSKRILMNFYFNPNSENPFRMAEVNEMRQFMTNFGEEVDVIWGATFDETLDNKIKITILAAGFDVTLEGETPNLEKAAPVKTATEKEAMERIGIEYGKEKIKQQTIDMAEARYFVLKPNDIDNDEIIDLLEKVPVVDRSQKIKARLKEMQENVTITPVRKPEVQQAKKGTATTIEFGS